ncbi:MAG: DsbA family oxidoreductase [Kiloniellales bacterium]|nr:DsbA family oxidoreductase [Kiloniellales bacterium]
MPKTITAEIRIDIVSDVVCPWCIIGYKQLEQALGESGVSAEFRWHPFELNPQMSEEGENLREHLAAKYGTTPEGSRQARARLTELGAELGFAFNYADDMRMYNTFRAHQLLHWAGTQGRQRALKMALFAAFFTHRRDVNDIEVLAEVAALIGLPKASALAVLTEGRFAEAVREEEAFWTSRGITGVPAMVFDQRYLLVGAQGAETYKRILEKLAEERAA